ncbi:hypothetical protein BKA70DRAFT_1481806, partial [Coprinopsis sp. MPI-PUGE-AT-0042]
MSELTEISEGLKRRSRSTKYYIQTVVICVEASLYSVPKQALTTQSPVFEGMFDVGDQSGGEGISDDKPIVLEGYRSDDFECLLKVLIPEPFELSPALSKQEWTSVLKLATIWQMDKARKAAIDQLSALDLSPIEKIQHAREYRVTTWFKEGIAAIANQSGKYKMEELGNALGWKTTALVEGCLYSVPKQALTSQSTFFEEMFDIGDQSSRDGGSDEEPIVLEGCTSADFECLLKVIYPRYAPNPPELSQDEWVSVLKLSTLWHMGEIRDAAIWELSTSLLDPVTKIQYSKRYNVSKWLTEGIVALARNLGEYTVKDLAELLGWETTALIFAARDK